MGEWISRTSEMIFHRLPKFKGRWRVLKVLNSIHRIGLKEPVTLAHMKLGYILQLDIRARTEYEAFYTGDYDNDVISKVVSWFKPNWVVLDVGANIGFYAIPFAKSLKRLDGNLYCFEPVPSNFNRLSENLKLNGLLDSAHIYKIGLSNQKGTAQITLREDFESGAETGNAAIIIEDGKDSCFKTLSIELTSLDQFVSDKKLQRIDYIKADIEGHEDMFFVGGGETIRKFRPIIQAELNAAYFCRKGQKIDSILQTFRNINYEIAMLDTGPLKRVEGTEARDYSHDLFLIPKEKFLAIE